MTVPTAAAAVPSRAGTVLLLVSALALAAAALAPSARADTDTTAPRLLSVPTAIPALVDATVPGASTTISVRLADDGTGVADATLTVRSPEGYRSDIELARDSGTTRDGTWTGVVPVDSFDAVGPWPAVEFVATDVAGNVLDVTTGVGNGYTVARRVDTTPPTLAGVSVDGGSPALADTSAGDAVVVVSVRAGDDLSGVVGGDLTFTSPDGDDGITATLDAAPVSGSTRDGTWTASVVVPARTAPGDWRLTHLSLVDGQGNTLDLDADDTRTSLPALAVRVRTDDDTAAPALTSFAIGPRTISTAYQRSGWLYAQVGFTDDASGLADATVTLAGPDGTDLEPGTVRFDGADARSGTSRAGSVAVPIFVADLVAGSYAVTAVTLTDLAGNVTTVPAAGLGATRTVTVSSAAADTAAPTVRGFTHSLDVVDTRSAAAGAAVLVAVTDPDAVPSGVAGGSVTLTSPSGRQSVTAAFDADDLVAGDPAAGTFRAEYSLDTQSEDGLWRITAATVTDVAGHTTTSAAGDLATAPTVLVYGAGRAAPSPPGAPGDVRATVSGTTATVTWTAPPGTITRYVVTPTADDGTVQPTVTTTRPAATVTRLPRGAAYTFSVTAESADGTGAASAPSDAVAVPYTAPSAPAIGRPALAGDTGATVAWTPPADDGGAPVTGYVLTPSLAGVARPAIRLGAVTGTTVTGLERGRTYSFRVAAVNAVGTGSASASSTTVTVPSVPGTLSASAPTRAAYAAAVTVSGKLVRGGTTSALAGRTVRVQYRRPGTTGWTTAATTARTTASGTVSLRLRVYRTVQVRLTAPAVVGFLGATSPVRTVTVRR